MSLVAGFHDPTHPWASHCSRICPPSASAAHARLIYNTFLRAMKVSELDLNLTSSLVASSNLHVPH